MGATRPYSLMGSIYSFIPLAVIIFLTALFWRIGPSLRLAWIAGGIVTIGCCLGDWFMLARLPQLGLSFGPVSPPLFLMGFIRLVPMLVAFSLIGSSTQVWQRIGLIAAISLFQVLFLATAYQGLFIEPFRLTVSNLEIPTAPQFLPDHPFRILQLSDLHVEHISPRERSMMERTQALAPDMIVLTGDYINKSYLTDPRTFQETRQLLSDLHAPYGVFAVNGNLDSPALMKSLFKGLDNIRVLDNAIVQVTLPGGTLYVAGATAVDHIRDYTQIQDLLAELPVNTYSLLLYHYPERVDIASAMGADVFLAGDTHGGQVRLPLIGAIATNHWSNSYIMGKYKVGPSTLYVSRGLGMQGGIWPRIRLNCPPEMVLVSLGK